MGRFAEEKREKGFLAEVVFSLIALSGAALVWFLFQDQGAFAIRYLWLVLGVGSLLAAYDIFDKKIPLSFVAFLRRGVHYISSIFLSVLMLVLVLPLVVVQFFLGPATLFLGLLALCCTVVSFFEEILGYDIVHVDVAREGPSFLLSISGLGLCAVSLGISYAIHRYGLFDKVYSLLGEVLRDVRPRIDDADSVEA